MSPGFTATRVWSETQSSPPWTKPGYVYLHSCGCRKANGPLLWHRGVEAPVAGLAGILDSQTRHLHKAALCHSVTWLFWCSAFMISDFTSCPLAVIKDLEPSKYPICLSSEAADFAEFLQNDMLLFLIPPCGAWHLCKIKSHSDSAGL